MCLVKHGHRAKAKGDLRISTKRGTPPQTMVKKQQAGATPMTPISHHMVVSTQTDRQIQVCPGVNSYQTTTSYINLYWPHCHPAT